MAIQGPVLHWVADHRRHHAFSEKEGDPQPPWLFGQSPLALARCFWHAHLGWIFDRSLANQERFAPDLVADADLRRVHRWFGLWTAISLLAPALMGG
jgi:stearoyl-CoA desaturase (delta-9 desaturase)